MLISWYGTSAFSLSWQIVILCRFRSASNFSSFEYSMSWSISEFLWHETFCLCYFPQDRHHAFHQNHFSLYWQATVTSFLRLHVLSPKWQQGHYSHHQLFLLYLYTLHLKFTSNAITFCFCTALWSWAISSFSYFFIKCYVGLPLGDKEATQCALLSELSNSSGENSHLETLKKWQDALLIVMGICHLCSDWWIEELVVKFILSAVTHI